MAIARWGLIPSWAKDMAMGAKMNNARAETVAEKPAFRAAFRRRRCLIPVDGWYEWRQEGGRKQPYFIYPQNRGVCGLAGLWEEWISPDGSPIESYAVVTTDADTTTGKIHDRMPVVIAPAQHSLWLEGEPRQASSLLRALEPGKLIFHKVDRRMSAARVDDAKCVETVSDEKFCSPELADSERQGRLL